MSYDVEAIRKKLKSQMGGKFADPDEFKPAKATSTTEAIKYRYFVLPPIQKGDVLKSGTAKETMDHFFLQHGNHWINMRPHPCPRSWDNSECEICQFGLDLLREEKDEDARKKIREIWLPSKYSMVNIYFTHWQGNPEELRGKVKYYNAPKTCLDIWTAALYRDDKGDEEEPEAHGVFYDEHAAFIFQLEVIKSGKQNSYKTSHFVTKDGEPVPMVGKKGEPNEKGIKALLRLRHNLFSKVEEPNPADIKKMFAFLSNADDQHEESGGFDKDETAPTDEAEAGPVEDESEAGPVEESEAEAGPTDDSSDDLAGEAPVQEETSDTEPAGDDVESEEISALLEQLDDED